MSITIDKEFESLIPSLSDDEFRQLEENCVRDGIRDPLVVWPQEDGNDILVDGHNRFRISAMHSGIRFDIKRMEFEDRDEVIAWICKNQLGRRNLHPLDQEKLLSTMRKAESKRAKARHGYRTDLHSDFKEKFPESGKQVRDVIGEKIGVSGRQVDKLHAINEKGTEALKQSVRDGEMSVNHAYLVATGKESKSPRQLHKEFIEEVKQEREDFQKKKDGAVVNFADIQQDKENAKIVARELYNKCLSMMNGISAIYIPFKEGELNLADMAQNISDSDRQLLKESIAIAIKDLQEIFAEVDI